MVRRIFTDFVMKKKTRTQVAKDLNADGIPNALGKPWTMQTVNNILKNERYIGHLMFNRTSFKLQNILRPKSGRDVGAKNNDVQRHHRPEVVCERATAPIADLAQCPQDQRQGPARSAEKPCGARRGRLTCSIINEAKGTPAVSVYVTHFGSTHERLQAA